MWPTSQLLVIQPLRGRASLLLLSHSQCSAFLPTAKCTHCKRPASAHLPRWLRSCGRIFTWSMRISELYTLPGTNMEIAHWNTITILYKQGLFPLPCLFRECAYMFQLANARKAVAVATMVPHLSRLRLRAKVAKTHPGRTCPMEFKTSNR